MYLRISCLTASRTRSRFLPSMLSWNVFFMRDGNAPASSEANLQPGERRLELRHPALPRSHGPGIGPGTGRHHVPRLYIGRARKLAQRLQEILQRVQGSFQHVGTHALVHFLTAMM